MDVGSPSRSLTGIGVPEVSGNKRGTSVGDDKCSVTEFPRDNGEFERTRGFTGGVVRDL